MQVQINQPSNQNSATICQLINLNKQIFTYYSNFSPQKHLQLTLNLLIEAIQNRSKNQNPPERYNVAYIKHHRFLSPTQKRAVTPKVTEVIPVSPSKHVIYGKPKVKIDQNLLQNLERERNSEAIAMQGQLRYISKEDLRKTDHEVNYEEQDEKEQQNEPYLIPKQKKVLSPKMKRQSKENLNYTKQKKFLSPQHVLIKTSPKNNLVNDRSESQFFEKQSRQKIRDVESKIKYLIDKDKNDKIVQKKFQKQNQKIDQLQKRQNKLLEKQFKQKKQLNRKTKQQPKRMDSCSSSEDDDVQSKIRKIREKLGISTLYTQHQYKSTSKLDAYTSKSKCNKIPKQRVFQANIQSSESQSELESHCKLCDCSCSSNLNESDFGVIDRIAPLHQYLT